MKVVIVCQSEHHGNTWLIAGAMAGVFEIEARYPGDIEPEEIAGADLAGFGSGIYAGRFGREILGLIEQLPENKGRYAFLFSTSGWGRERYNRGAAEKLKSKGYRVAGSFACRGYDTFGPFKLIGGISRNRPNESDLENAADFARSVRDVVKRASFEDRTKIEIVDRQKEIGEKD